VPRKKLAIAYIVKGLMPQLINKVRATGLRARPAFTTSWKSIFTMIGYIMKNRHTAIGIDTTGASFMVIAIASRLLAKSGAISPSRMPNTMHSPTHTVRYLSNIPITAGTAVSLLAIWALPSV
jgi:hypothetical protein